MKKMNTASAKGLILNMLVASETRTLQTREAVEALRTRLHRLGLESQAVVIVASELSDKRKSQARKLWDADTLNASYRQIRERLEHSIAKLDELHREDASRETFLLGEAAVRQIIYDPLLPAPLINENERRQCLACVHRYARIGHEIWQIIANERSDGRFLDQSQRLN